MRNSIFKRLRKLGEWKHSEETFKESSGSSFPTPEKLQVKSDVTNLKRYLSLKEKVLKDMSKWSDYSPNEKFRVITFRRREYDTPIYDRVIQELIELGWEVATREYVELVPCADLNFPDNPLLTRTIERYHFDILVAYPGTIDSSIENTDFVVCKKGVSLDGKQQTPQNVGKDELLKRD